MTITEVVPIEGIDLEGTPPCTVLYPGITFTSITSFAPTWERCGKPSAYRVITVCMTCGKSLDFMCQPCLEHLKAGTCVCLRHQDERREFEGYA